MILFPASRDQPKNEEKRINLPLVGPFAVSQSASPQFYPIYASAELFDNLRKNENFKKFMEIK